MDLPSAPNVPHDNLSVASKYNSVSAPGPAVSHTITGETCDFQRCPAIAYVRVTFYGDPMPGFGLGPLLGRLHFCGHHYVENELELQSRALQRRATIVDERQRISNPET